MTRPKKNSTVEKPAEVVEAPAEQPKTIASLLGTEDPAKQIEVLDAIIREMVTRQQMREIFINLRYSPSEEKLGINFTRDASFDDILAVLGAAQQRVVEARLKAKEAEEAKKQDQP